MKWLTSTILLLSLFSYAFAQEARKIEEFGNLGCDDFLTRKDNFIYYLNLEPNAIGYIFVYEGKLQEFDYSKEKVQTYYVLPRVGEARRYLVGMKDRFEMGRFPLERLVFANAGFREKFTVEFWIKPSDASPPKPTPTLTKIKYRKGKPKNFCGEF